MVMFSSVHILYACVLGKHVYRNKKQNKKKQNKTKNVGKLVGARNVCVIENKNLS